MSATPSFAALFGPQYRALMVAALGATFLGSLDALMVITALPSAAQDIGGVDLISIAVGAVMVTIVLSLPIAGGVIDRYGAARCFAVGCALFAVANVIGGLAPTMEVVAVSRAILGIGAGFMFAVPLGLFALYVPDALRPRAFGLNAATWGVSAVIGPALGAGLTSTVGWRWVFWINLPLVAIVAWAAALALRAHVSRPPAAVAPLNFVGPLLLSLTVLPLLLTAADVRLALLTVIPAALFLWHERRTPAPIFTHRPVSLAATVTSATAGAAFLGSEVYLPLQIQVGFGDPVWVVAIALVAATLGWTAGSVGAARLDASPADQILVGTCLVFVSTLVMAIPAGGATLPIAAYGFAGLGMGIASPALFAVVLADGREGREGQSTSAVPLARQVGAGLGTALVGVVFTLSLSQQTIHAAEQANAHVPDVVPAVRLTYLVAAVLGGIGVIACRWLREPSRRVISDLT